MPKSAIDPDLEPRSGNEKINYSDYKLVKRLGIFIKRDTDQPEDLDPDTLDSFFKNTVASHWPDYLGISTTFLSYRNKTIEFDLVVDQRCTTDLLDLVYWIAGLYRIKVRVLQHAKCFTVNIIRWQQPIGYPINFNDSIEQAVSREQAARDNLYAAKKAKKRSYTYILDAKSSS